VASAREEIRAPTDDRPFFFYFKKLPDLLRPSGLMNDPGLWIMISLGTVFVLAGTFVIAPLFLRRGRPLASQPGASEASTLAYFGLVGLAFMTIEIAMLQRFTLFLGHPSYSLIVILFALLLSTALGAHLSGRFAVARLERVLFAGGAVMAAFGALGGLFLADLLRALIGLPLWVRVLLTVWMVAPSGVVMGLMIPGMIRVLGAARSALVPWGWAVNGATSVIGTVLATVIAIYGGFTATFLVGAAAYLVAGALGSHVARRLGSP
jgi:hypothetical protein